MSRSFKNILIVSLSTVGSRVAGLLRDVVVFALLGTGLVNSAFITAFTLPNLFRRLLGEGALTSAVVPVFSEEMERGGREAAYGLLNRVLSRLAVVLAALVAGLMGVCELARGAEWLPEKWQVAAGLAVGLMPYLLMVCLAAILAAALNMVGKFGLAALSQVWLNLSMIVGIGVFGQIYGESAEERVWWLCGGVLVGGALQAVLPCVGLKRAGWRWQWDFSPSPALRQVFALFLPGMLGAAVMQLNTTISRFLAYSLDDRAVSVLYLANRLVELPLGVFVVAVSTVFFPDMARFAARGEREAFAHRFQQGVRLILAITIPAALGLALLAEPILRTLFEYGAFQAADVRATATLLVAFAAALPFYGYATMATRAFHSLRDMRFPMRVAVWNLVLNIGLSLLLMQWLGALGLALANGLASAVQCAIMARELGARDHALGFGVNWRELGKIGLAGAGMALVVTGGYLIINTQIGDGKQGALASVGLLIPLGIGVYFGLLRWRQFSEMEELVRLLKRRGKAS